MNKNNARTIADALTWARMFSVVPITALAAFGLRWCVFGLYIAAALTDLLDGMFARRAAPPRSDVDLDGIADLIFRLSTIFWFWLLIPGFVSKYWFPYLPTLLLLELYLTVVRVRHQRFGVPHLQFGRIAMVLFSSLLPVLIIWGDVPWFVHGVLIIGIASMLQLAWAFRTRSKSRIVDLRN
jgi:phosphatidylglycerophosphate synthase